MTTNTRSEATATTGHEDLSLADERLLHPLRPARRRPVREPHGRTTAVGGRTTAAGRAPSSARRPHPAPLWSDAGPIVAPTAIPDHSGDLLGLPDLAGFRRGLRRAWEWLVREVRASAEIDARIRARRDQDSADMSRGGVNPTRLV